MLKYEEKDILEREKGDYEKREKEWRKSCWFKKGNLKQPLNLTPDLT